VVLPEIARPQLKVNRAGTRGLRAPEVLLKCPEQTTAIDIWSAGTALLFFLCGRFPIFRSNDDTEALMEIATIIGKQRMERVAALHGLTFS
jgi:cell division control protein 7